MSCTASVKFSCTRTLLTLICLLVDNGPMQMLFLWCCSYLYGSMVFLLSWRPSMMEKELAGSTSLLSLSKRQ